VGYNRFTDGTVVNWNITENGIGKVASGQFAAIGGGKLGSKTYHFLTIPLGVMLKAEPVQSHAHFHWADQSYAVTRDPGCTSSSSNASSSGSGPFGPRLVSHVQSTASGAGTAGLVFGIGLVATLLAVFGPRRMTNRLARRDRKTRSS
jgi:hypothetical protein